MPEFPVLLILNLKGKRRLEKVQLLAHDYMIPQRVALYCGNFTKNSEKKIWKQIGFVKFNENAIGGQQELKTIDLRKLNIQGQYLKLELHQCYNNLRNRFNQVALEAINISGDRVTNEAEDLAQQYLDHADNDLQNEGLPHYNREYHTVCSRDLLLTKMTFLTLIPFIINHVILGVVVPKDKEEVLKSDNSRGQKISQSHGSCSYLRLFCISGVCCQIR